MPQAHIELFEDGKHAVMVIVKITTDEVLNAKYYPTLALNIAEALERSCDEGYGICPDASPAFTCEIDVGVIGEQS